MTTPDLVIDQGAPTADSCRGGAEDKAFLWDAWRDEPLAVRPDACCLERWLDLNA